MSKGWKGERNRHAMSARGIKTKKGHYKVVDSEDKFMSEVTKYYDEGFTNEELQEILYRQNIWNTWSWGDIMTFPGMIDEVYDMAKEHELHPKIIAAMAYVCDNKIITLHDEGKMPGKYKYAETLKRGTFEEPVILLMQVDIEFDKEW